MELTIYDILDIILNEKTENWLFCLNKITDYVHLSFSIRIYFTGKILNSVSSYKREIV